jgi:hypothetical protein
MSIENLMNLQDQVEVIQIYNPSVGLTGWYIQTAKCRVPLDKNEGAVKGVVVVGGAQAPPGLPERLRTKTLEISR